jgi:hypothetical protein
MADTLSDIYPVPVKYVDGQQPTARFLNAWAAQVDLAFAILARIIGDFDGESSELPTYISNLSRTLGSMGWLDSRLPRGLRYGLDDTEEYPTIVEVISPLSKEAMLMFPPVNGGTLTAGGSISDWTRKNVGSPVALGLHLNDEEQWTNWGRRILATSIIPLAATIEYSVDPDTAADRADDYYDTWGPGTGASVVPNLYEIASSMTEGGLEELCECVEEDAVLWIEMPKIRRVSNLSLPFSTGADVLNVEFDNEGATVRWSDDGHAPRYTIPPYIFELAGEDGQIPDGLVSLWVKNGESITRVVNQNSEEQLSFFVDETDRKHVKVVTPEDFSLPHEIDGQEALATQYILAFAGVSVTEAIGHLRGRASSHKHDGTAEDGLVAAASISHRFSPSEYSHSKIAYNHYPQYLLRSGYSEDADPLNRDNALFGHLLISSSEATASNGESPNQSDTSSYGIYFGDFGTGPMIDFDREDDAIGYANSGLTGKLTVGRKPLRVQSLFFGSDDGWLVAVNGTFRFGVEGSELSGGATLKAGALALNDNSEIEYGELVDDPYGPMTGFAFTVDAGLDPDESAIRVGLIRSEYSEAKSFALVTEEDYVTPRRIFLHAATAAPLRDLAFPLVLEDLFGDGGTGEVASYGYGSDATRSAGMFARRTNDVDGIAGTLIVPVPLHELASAANLGVDSTVLLTGYTIWVENASGAAGKYRCSLYRVSLSTGDREEILSSRTFLTDIADASRVSRVMDFAADNVTVNLNEEYLEMEIELGSSVGYMGGFLLASSSFVG